MSDRQTGRTTQQMLNAPLGAVFVWVNQHLYYPISLARRLGRTDLEVRPLSWLEPRNVMGRKFTAVIVDHAAQPYGAQLQALRLLRCRQAVMAD